jgi:hypothetical protein
MARAGVTERKGPRQITHSAVRFINNQPRAIRPIVEDFDYFITQCTVAMNRFARQHRCAGTIHVIPGCGCLFPEFAERAEVFEILISIHGYEKFSRASAA